ncbi:hypothetical protein V2W34_13300 [Virgibacillus dokdonensis]|uniref:Resolvase HTH domain-containing protein n=1 Tax=Virgibacillus dokdonensis TaxID=302167 RepID=A0ABU7VH12_9BACI|nr:MULTISPECIES: hypothetical protein [Virgibacillus]NWO12997.1 hypothetical protein [Virgibacillus sp.]
MVTSILILVSFLLHMVAFTVIFQLYKRMNTNQQLETSEIDALLAAYIDEIKQENIRLQQQLITLNKRENVETDQIQLVKKEEKDVPYNNEQQDEMTTSLQAKILQLHSQGHTASEIAQQLNCGKTEVALTIKFQQNSKINSSK